MVYFTSDLHLGHRNILRLCDRPFASIEEMDEVLMDNWNRKVHRDDAPHLRHSIKPVHYSQKSGIRKCEYRFFELSAPCGA